MNIRARKLIMKNLFKIIACLVIILQLVLLAEKGNDLINYDGYLGLPKGSYSYPVPYHSIVSICCLITLFTINMLILIIKKKSFFIIPQLRLRQYIWQLLDMIFICIDIHIQPFLKKSYAFL